MNTNLKGELSVMDSLGIKPNYAALGRKYKMDWRTVKNITMDIKVNHLLETKEVNWILIKQRFRTN